MDWESIAAGLLHDTVEDTNVVTFETIEKEFGPIVRRIVEGETKVFFSSMFLFSFSHLSWSSFGLDTELNGWLTGKLGVQTWETQV